MSNYKNATPFTRTLDRFAYHTEDLNCADCLFLILKSERKNKDNGCGKEVCRFNDIRQEAIAKGRFKRPRGWFKCRG